MWNSQLDNLKAISYKEIWFKNTDNYILIGNQYIEYKISNIKVDNVEE